MKIKKFKISILNLFLALVSCVSVSYAWFAMNSHVESTDMSLDIQEASAVTTVSAFVLKYDGVYGASCYSLMGDSTKEITMTEYDKIFKDRNVNTPLIYCVEIGNVITNSKSYIKLKIPCSEDYIKLSNNTKQNTYAAAYNYSTNHFTDKNAFMVQHYISNVLRIKLDAGDNSLIPTPAEDQHYDNNELIFTSKHTDFNNLAEGSRNKTFCSIATNTASNTKDFSKEKLIELQMTYSEYSSKLYDAYNADGTTSKHLVLYILFDYDTYLMESFIDSTKEEENIYFFNDLSLISIENGVN